MHCVNLIPDFGIVHKLAHLKQRAFHTLSPNRITQRHAIIQQHGSLYFLSPFENAQVIHLARLMQSLNPL